MHLKSERLLDRIGINILGQLQENARIALSEIGRRVGLSSPAVAERVHKLEDAGVICGYHAAVDPEKIGYPVSAFIFLTTSSPQYGRVHTFAQRSTQIVECHHISGSESFLMKVVAHSVSHLDQLIEKLSEFGETKTSIVLSTPVRKNAMVITG